MFRRLLRSTLGVVLCAVLASPAGSVIAARRQAAAPALTIAGDVRTPISLTPEELKGMPRTRVDLKGEDGRTTTYEGVLMGEILKRAGATLGSDLRGAALATYVVASATDGYQVVFSIGELDPTLTTNEIIVADTIDGKPLNPAQGPLRLVAPQDRRPARSVRMLDRIDVVRFRK